MCNFEGTSRYQFVIKRIFHLFVLVVVAATARASVTNLITNGSFESGTNGWMLFVASTNVTFQTNATAYKGAWSLRVANRQNFAEAPQQDVTTQLALATNGATWVTRLAVQVAQPAQVRAWLAVAAIALGANAARLRIGARPSEAGVAVGCASLLLALLRITGIVPEVTLPIAVATVALPLLLVAISRRRSALRRRS